MQSVAHQTVSSVWNRLCTCLSSEKPFNRLLVDRVEELHDAYRFEPLIYSLAAEDYHFDNYYYPRQVQHEDRE